MPNVPLVIARRFMVKPDVVTTVLLRPLVIVPDTDKLDAVRELIVMSDASLAVVTEPSPIVDGLTAPMNAPLSSMTVMLPTLNPMVERMTPLTSNISVGLDVPMPMKSLTL